MYKNKKLGQFFLKKKYILLKIINNIKKIKKKYDLILEIGAGTGNLSKLIFKITNKCLFIEIDKELINILKKKVKKEKILNINIFDYKFKKKKKILIVGNFPFYISSKILLWLLKNRKFIIGCIGTLQKNFIDKIKKKKTKLSLLINFFFKIKILFKIKKKNFIPRPKVDAYVFKLTKKKKKSNINIKLFFNFIKELFKYKRKTIFNSLKYLLKKNNKIKENKLFKKRIDNLSIKKIIKLYIYIKKKCKINLNKILNKKNKFN